MEASGLLKNMDIDFEFFEKVLVRQSIVDSGYLSAIIDYVKPEYFEDKRIASYFEIVKSFYENRYVLPTLTEIKTYLIDDNLKNGFKDLLVSFKEIDKNLDKSELYDNTERFLKEKSVFHTLLKVGHELSEGKVNTGEILQQFETCCNIALIPDRGIELYSDVDLIVDDILNVESTISSGWKWLDDAIGGGYREDGKSLYVFAGPANIGKSIFLGNVATNISKHGKTVLVITLEMSELLYAKRMSSSVTKIPLKEFSSSAKSLKYMLQEQGAKNPDGKIFIKEFPPSALTPKQLGAFIKRFQDSGVKIDAIVIDYINLLTSTVGNNSYEKIKYICEEVRALSYKFKCPIISATQVNRTAYGISNPGMESLSESMGTAFTADVILSIFQNEEDQELNIIRLGMMKNRYGPRGMVQPMNIDYQTLTITQSEDEEVKFDEGELSILERFAN